MKENSPMKIVTLIRLDNGQPFVTRAVMVDNPSDGSVSFQLPDNNNEFVGQEPWLTVPGAPNTYGVRYPDSPISGAYQRATLKDNLVVFQTRPQDIPCVYLLGQGQAF